MTALLFFVATAAHARTLVVIAHPSVPANKIDRTELADYFMKRKRSWPSGQLVRPVDMVDGSPEREMFLKSVLKRSAREMTRFWIGQKLYTGDYAPLQLDSKKAVLHFVATVPGALGYVMRTTSDDLQGVKILAVWEE